MLFCSILRLGLFVTLFTDFTKYCLNKSEIFAAFNFSHLCKSLHWIIIHLKHISVDLIKWSQRETAPAFHYFCWPSCFNCTAVYGVFSCGLMSCVALHFRGTALFTYDLSLANITCAKSKVFPSNYLLLRTISLLFAVPDIWMLL